jgi:hypothetical protein
VLEQGRVLAHHATEMKRIMKNTVGHVFCLLALKQNDPAKYEPMIEFDHNT